MPISINGEQWSSASTYFQKRARPLLPPHPEAGFLLAACLYTGSLCLLGSRIGTPPCCAETLPFAGNILSIKGQEKPLDQSRTFPGTSLAAPLLGIVFCGEGGLSTAKGTWHGDSLQYALPVWAGFVTSLPPHTGEGTRSLTHETSTPPFNSALLTHLPHCLTAAVAPEKATCLDTACCSLNPFTHLRFLLKLKRQGNRTDLEDLSALSLLGAWHPSNTFTACLPAFPTCHLPIAYTCNMPATLPATTYKHCSSHSCLSAPFCVLPSLSLSGGPILRKGLERTACWQGTTWAGRRAHMRGERGGEETLAHLHPLPMMPVLYSPASSLCLLDLNQLVSGDCVLCPACLVAHCPLPPPPGILTLGDIWHGRRYDTGMGEGEAKEKFLE